MGTTSLEFQSLLYRTAEDNLEVDALLKDDTIWMTQKAMGQLFGCSTDNIGLHLKNIFQDEELVKDSVTEKISATASDGKKYLTNFYNLDAIISIGYRVNSKKATNFRIWATGVLKEYIAKGYAMDDNRLKELGDGDYWKELLDRIRDIRSSEKVFYRQVLDLYATSADYDPTSAESRKFFKMVQNKLHYAAHGHTAAEVIYERADAGKPFMGLTSFSGDFPAKKDISIAKNYLTEEEIANLNNLVSGYFEFAELQARRRKPMFMEDYIRHLDNILAATDEAILQGTGQVSHSKAMEKAETEYRAFQAQNLSPVEEQYLSTIHELAEEANKKAK